MSGDLRILPLLGMPELDRGAPLGALVVEATGRAGIELEDSDVVVIAQKAVSKAEGRTRDLAEVKPGERARTLAERLGKDERLVELILAESRRVVRAERGVLIVETRSGWVCANGGVDASNAPGEDSVVLLPEDPDRSARRLRAEIAGLCTARPAVIVADSFGRPWRLGQVDLAIGCAGVAPLDDWRGQSDRDGRELASTEIAIADELAAAADLARDKVAGVPAVAIRGAGRWVTADDGPGAAALRRAEAEDLFR